MSSTNSPTISPGQFYKTPEPPAKRVKVETRPPLFEQQMPRWMRSVVDGPTLQWKVFNRQADALQFSKDHGQGLMTFVFQDGDGVRRFLSAHPVVFWFYDNTIKRPEDRHTYEVITEGAICKLYFDLEYERAFNDHHNGVQMTDTFIKVVSWFLRDTFSVECDRKCVLDLDSTTDVKFSRHLVFQLSKTYFRDNYNVGNFVKMICTKLRMIVSSPMLMEELSKNCNVSEEDLMSLFVSDKNGEKKIFCDEAVYTKNRHFRLFKSSKWMKNAPLVLSIENQFESAVTGKEPLAEKELFLDSLISYVDKNQTNIKVLEYGPTEPKTYVVKSMSSLPECPLILEQGVTSPLPFLDKFIHKLVSPGYIRRSKYFSEKNTIVYEISAYRYCHNVGRHHKSNNIYFVVDLKSHTFYQKCHDPDCSGFRSEEKCLPPEIVFNLENDEDSVLESVPLLSDEELQDVWLAVTSAADIEALDSASQDTEKYFPEFGLSDSELLDSSHAF